ncbi:RNAse M5 [Desulfonispora thiosulfatigenes DSM 11270]|uniref:Ribonuclease M5 n=1 Tax=Desulfonispora thiosulfatigenes DSM 11270 TaxID=656914 RepID=A0A1W1V0K3_DESTI|nr:ribonuclease M5 [Desulfonispora thiosulfatigenes]SMB86849.1 RNAse M5 [Desulfonispora thiosulfatigenes DSM 11270]
MIKEVIVVEGKDDIQAVKRAVDAQMICTSGMGITKDTIIKIQRASERCGIIILTDPDYPGERIRSIISQKVKNCKQAYVTKSQARCKKTGKIGVEYANPEDIIKALEGAKAEHKTYEVVFTEFDLMQWNLVGPPAGNKRREKLGNILGIGKTNAKQFLRRLNAYDISKEEVEKGLAQLEGSEKVCN